MRYRLPFLALPSLFAALLPLNAEPPRVQIEHDSAVLCVTWSKNGDRVAAGTADGTVLIIDPGNGKIIQRFATGNSIAGLAFSPDGRLVALSQPNQGISAWDVANGKKQKSSNIKTYKAEHLAFTPDGQTVIGTSFGEFVQWKLSGSFTASKTGGNAAGCAGISPEGAIGGWADAKGKVQLREFNPTKTTTVNLGTVKCIAFGPAGKLMAFGGADNDVHLRDIKGKKEIAKLTGLQAPPINLSFSGDGHTLAALAGDGVTVRVWDLTRNTTRRQIASNRGALVAIALSPDGKMLAATGQGGKLLIWHVGTREVTHKGPPLKLTAKELAGLWADLSDKNYDKSDAAWHKFAAAGDNAVPFLQQQIRPIAVPPIDIKHLDKLVADLDAEKFAVRDKATKELMAAGELAVAPLERLLDRKSTGEAATRARMVLKKLTEPVLTPDRLRVLETIELLEAVRTTKAIRLLEEIEADTLIAQIRREAKHALDRIGGRDGKD